MSEPFLRTPTKATGSLTDEEKSKMAEITKKWTKIAYRTEPADIKKIGPAVHRLYAAANLPLPKVILAPSPIVMAFAHGIASTWWKLKGCKIQTTRAAIGAATWDSTGAATEAATWAATRDATKDATRDATEDATRAATRVATGVATRVATRQATRAATGAATGVATRQATRAATWDATGDAKNQPWIVAISKGFLGDNWKEGIKEINQWVNSYQGGNMWAGFCNYAEACRDVLGLTGLGCWNNYQSWEDCAKEGGFRVLHPKYCIVSDFPEQILIDSQNRPHNEHGPSHRWRDGWSLYHLHGVRFDEAMYYRIVNRTMSAKEIMQIEDIDQRVQAMKFSKDGYRDWFVSEGGVKRHEYQKVDAQERITRYELWRVPKGKTFTRDVQFAIYDCPSSLARNDRREYCKGVPDDVNTIPEALSWGMSSEDVTVSPESWELLEPLVTEA